LNYLLDTCIVCELRRRYPDSRIVDWLDSIDDEDIFISVVTLAAIQTAVEHLFRKQEKKAAKIENWLNLIAATPRVIPIEDEIIRLATRWQYENPGINQATTLICATATAGNLMLVTKNPKAYEPLDRVAFNPSCIPEAFFKMKR